MHFWAFYIATKYFLLVAHCMGSKSGRVHLQSVLDVVKQMVIGSVLLKFVSSYIFCSSLAFNLAICGTLRRRVCLL